jgi:hypothetical protein
MKKNLNKKNSADMQLYPMLNENDDIEKVLDEVKQGR